LRVEPLEAGAPPKYQKCDFWKIFNQNKTIWLLKWHQNKSIWLPKKLEENLIHSISQRRNYTVNRPWAGHKRGSQHERIIYDPVGTKYRVLLYTNMIVGRRISQISPNKIAESKMATFNIRICICIKSLNPGTSERFVTSWKWCIWASYVL